MNVKHVLKLWDQYKVNVATALTFGLVAITTGLVIGRPDVNFAAVLSIMMSSYMLADTSRWLMKVGIDERPEWRRAYEPLALYAVLVILYSAAVDGNRGQPLAAYYLTVLLAVICYKVRAGLIASILVGALYLVNARIEHPFSFFAWRDAVLLASFPVAALFIGMLARRLEDRFFALNAKATELSALLDMSQMMDSAADLDTTLSLVLLNVEKLSACDVSAVYLKNGAGDMLELRAASGPRNRLTLASSIAVAEARTATWSLEETIERAIGGTAYYAPHADAPGAGGSRLFHLNHRARSFACIPLASIEGLLGMLYVGYDQPGSLTTDRVQQLEHLAVRAAFPLQRAVMQQGFQSLAFSDAMTGLDNFRRFEQDLESEMRRAERYGRSLSVILLDIDYFKKFNDTLGHQAGDALLAQLATVLRDSLRSLDKPARYGGEEFVVVCPETGAEEAHVIAERIRRNVEAAKFSLIDEGQEGHDVPAEPARVTVSVGYATYPADAAGSRDLVKCADKALYASKEAGRNTVRSYSELPALLLL